MFSQFERIIAFRYLRSRRSEGFISVIAAFSLTGIALGVATLIVVMAVMNGFREELVTRILGLNGHISVHATTQENSSNFTSVSSNLQNISSVIHVTPILEGQVMATNNKKYTGAIVRGIEPNNINNFPILSNNIVNGSILDFKNNNGVLIGQGFARKLGLRNGDAISIISPHSTSTAFGSVPRARSYKISGIFDLGMFEYDNGYIFMPLGLAQLHFKMPRSITRIDLATNNAEIIKKTTNLVKKAVGPGWKVQDWKERHSHFVNALKVERNVMFVILALIILVAAFNIISGLIMVVKDKEHDIAILRTMGATRGQVMRIFFINGASIGVVGTIIGVILGSVFADNINSIRLWLESLSGAELFAPEVRFLSDLPAIITWENVLTVALMSICLAFLATLYPSWRAARVDPAKALRDE